MSARCACTHLDDDVAVSNCSGVVEMWGILPGSTEFTPQQARDLAVALMAHADDADGHAARAAAVRASVEAPRFAVAAE